MMAFLTRYAWFLAVGGACAWILVAVVYFGVVRGEEEPPTNEEAVTPTSIRIEMPPGSVIKEEVVGTPTASQSEVQDCTAKKYCTEMTDCAEARRYLIDCGLTGLDKDQDGTPCDSLCGK